jgi:hypothetical protein
MAVESSTQAHKRWLAPVGRLDKAERVKLARLLGVRYEQLHTEAVLQHPDMPFVCALLARQRTEPDVPDTWWETLTLDDIHVIAPADPTRAEADPTSAG